MAIKINKHISKQIINYLLVALGTFLLTFGTVIFLTETELVAGGISGIAIIIQHFVNVQIYDYVVLALTVVFWLLGLILIGKDFAMKTLFSSILYIGFTFLFTRLEFFNKLAIEFSGKTTETGQTVGNLILCSIFGGMFIGGGVATTFLGGGSTGGVDVFQILFRKWFGIKESITSVMVDIIVILVGMFAMQLWNESLCGILSCVITAMFIETIYIKNQSSYQADIISDKWEEISRYVQDELGRGATVIQAVGGYKGDERVILRVVFDKMQYEKLSQFIADVDPKAFVTFTQTNAVYGEGFEKRPEKKMKKKKKDLQ